MIQLLGTSQKYLALCSGIGRSSNRYILYSTTRSHNTSDNHFIVLYKYIKNFLLLSWIRRFCHSMNYFKILIWRPWTIVNTLRSGMRSFEVTFWEVLSGCATPKGRDQNIVRWVTVILKCERYTVHTIHTLQQQLQRLDSSASMYDICICIYFFIINSMWPGNYGC